MASDEWMEASIEGKWRLLRKTMTRHLWFNVAFTLGAMGLAVLFDAPALAEGILYVVLALYFITLLLSGVVMLLLFILSSLIDEKDGDGSSK